MNKRGSIAASDKNVPLRDDETSPAAVDRRIEELELRLRDTEQALRLSSSKLRMALDVGKLGSWERDLETGIVTGSQSFKACFGLPPDSMLTYEELKRLFHPADVERIEQAITYSLRTRTDFNIQHRVLRADGRVARVLARGGAIYDGDKPVRLAGILLDVTERERAKEEANLAQHRQEFLLKLNDQLSSLGDPNEIMEASARSLALLLKVDSVGYGEVYLDRRLIVVEREWSKGAFSNEGHAFPMDIVPAYQFPLMQNGQPILIEDVETDPRHDLSAKNFYRNANVRSALAVSLLRNAELKAVLYCAHSTPRSWTAEDVALTEDVAERTWIAVEKARAERELRETEARFQLIAESLPALVWILNPNTELTYTNERWVKFSGLPPEEALGHSWTKAIHPDDWERMQVDLLHVVANHTPYETEARYRSASGDYRWHLIQGAPIHSATGEFKGWVGTSVDIHDLKMTEEALRTNEQQLRIALQAAKMGDWRWDAKTDVTTLSDRAAEIFGLSPGSSPTREELNRLIHPADLPRVISYREKTIRDKAQYSVEYRVRRADDKSQIWVATQGQAIYDRDDSFIGMIGVLQDITDRKHAEERQHLLIRELHHRVKNTLATVQAIVGSTARTASSIDEFYQGFVGRIVSLARTHNLLTEDLWQKASLEELIETELGPYQDEARNHIVIEGPHVELPSEAAVPIGMAIHELTTNAAKHGALSTFGGRVEVRWNTEPGDERPMLHFSWKEKGGPHVTAPSRQGFGSRLLQRVLTTQLQARVDMDFREDGLHFTMIMPIPGEPPLFNPDS